MKLIAEFLQLLKRIHTFTKNVLWITGALSIGLYISSFVILLIAPFSPNYLYALTLHHGTIEAGNATIVAGISAAVISDLAFASYKRKTRNHDDKDL